MLAQRFAAFEVRLQRPQQCRLFDACRIGLFLLLLRDAVEPQLHQAEIGNCKLEIHHLDVAQRIDGAARVKHRIVFERANDVAERVHVLELAEPLLARLRLLGWSWRERTFDLGVFRFFRFIQRVELVDARVGYLDHADGVIARSS